MRARQIDNLVEDAERVLDDFMRVHHAAAIPALIGCCVSWAVQNGGADLVKHSLRNAIKMADEMAAIQRKGAQ